MSNIDEGKQVRKVEAVEKTYGTNNNNTHNHSKHQSVCTDNSLKSFDEILSNVIVKSMILTNNKGEIV